jgi:hypothetical protein
MNQAQAAHRAPAGTLTFYEPGAIMELTKQRAGEA